MITIRKALEQDCPGIATVQVDSYRSAYKRIFPDAYIAHFTYEEQAGDWKAWFQTKKDEFLFMAEDKDGKVIGYTLVKIQAGVYAGYDAELVALHVKRSIHRQGIGKALLAKAVQELKKRGSGSVMLWTLKENPVRRWYERLGGMVLGEKRYDVDDREIVEIVYGWEDTHYLGQSLR